MPNILDCDREALEDFQALQYARANLVRPEPISREDWAQVCRSLATNADAILKSTGSLPHLVEEWKQFHGTYLIDRPPVSRFEDPVFYTCLMRSVHFVSSAVLAQNANQQFADLFDSLLIGTVPHGEPSAIVSLLTGTKRPALIFDSGLQCAFGWIRALYATVLVPSDSNHYNEGTGTISAKALLNEAADFTDLFSSQLVHLITQGKMEAFVQIQGVGVPFGKALRSQGFIQEAFVVGHELAHVILGHLEGKDETLDGPQLVDQRHKEEFEADYLGFLLTMQANSWALRSVDSRLNIFLDLQVVTSIEFFLWFYQAIECLVMSTSFDTNVHFLASETHPSSAIRRYQFSNTAINVLLDAFQKSSDQESVDLLLRNANMTRDELGLAWNIVISVARIKLQKALKEGATVSPLWSTLAPCDGPDELKPREASLQPL